MWDAIMPVADHHDPVIYEGKEPATVVVLNAGPGIIELRAWTVTAPDDGEIPAARLEMRPGSSKSVRGSLIRAAFKQAANNDPLSARFAAIGWAIKP